MNVLDRIKGTPYEGCVTRDSDGFYFRDDIGDQDPKEASEIFYIVVQDLADLGLELIDPMVEHDCISGGIVVRPPNCPSCSDQQSGDV